MSFIFSSESVSEGHPDKVADLISDAILDEYLSQDSNARVACEVMVTNNTVIISGEIKSSKQINIKETVKKVIKSIGYNNSKILFNYKTCNILTFISSQSNDISMGIEKKIPEEQGAGDQGIMFGYATNETKSYIPISLDLSHKILKELSKIRKENKTIKYLRPDSKCQTTIEYLNHNKFKLKSLVISTQHDDFSSDKEMLIKIKEDIKHILIPRVINKYPEFKCLFDNKTKYYINPTGKFVIGGPEGDTGLTGRKIIVDTYGGKGAHGGGAFSGKDTSKVDRSAAYAARHLAKNIVAAGISDECLIQVSYAIGVANNLNLYVNTFNKSNLSISDKKIAEIVSTLYDFRPYVIEKKLNLRNPIFYETASYGHFGRCNKIIEKSFNNDKKIKVELFTWEKLDYVEILKKHFKKYYKNEPE